MKNNLKKSTAYAVVIILLIATTLFTFSACNAEYKSEYYEIVGEPYIEYSSYNRTTTIGLRMKNISDERLAFGFTAIDTNGRRTSSGNFVVEAGETKYISARTSIRYERGADLDFQFRVAQA